MHLKSFFLSSNLNAQRVQDQQKAWVVSLQGIRDKFLGSHQKGGGGCLQLQGRLGAAAFCGGKVKVISGER